LERRWDEILLLHVQAVSERRHLLPKFELLEAVEAEIGGLDVLGAKSARELTKA
jgi:hypothetical protein